MSHFIGGSASAMARQISDGFTLVNAVLMKRFSLSELDQLQFELERKLRDLRGVQVDLTDTLAIQGKNRRISRLDGALRVLRMARQTRMKGGGQS